jgi:hypothetical protein
MLDSCAPRSVARVIAGPYVAIDPSAMIRDGLHDGSRPSCELAATRRAPLAPRPDGRTWIAARRSRGACRAFATPAWTSSSFAKTF